MSAGEQKSGRTEAAQAAGASADLAASGGSSPGASAVASTAAPWRMAAAGLAAAVVAWLIVISWYPFLRSGLSFAPGAVPSAEESAMLTRYRWQNSAAMFAIFGSLLGASLGAVAGFRRAAVVACFSGAVFGAACGALASWCVLWLADQPFDAVVDSTQPYAEMVKWLIVHSIAWMITGLGAGFGSALPWASWAELRRKTVGAVLGGLLAGPCFQFLMALIELVSPMGGTDALIPERRFIQLVWLATAGVLIGLLAGAVGAKPAGKRKPAPPASASPGG